MLLREDRIECAEFVEVDFGVNISLSMLNLVGNDWSVWRFLFIDGVVYIHYG